MDEYEYLENLSDPRTISFIEKENKETESKLGKRAKKLYPILLEMDKEPYVLNMFAYDEENPAILLYGEKSKLVLGNNTIYTPPEGYVASEIWKVYNSKEIGVSIERKGSDKIITLLISPEGKIRELGEMIESPFYFKGELCYIKSFRYSPPPDGGDYPADRVFCKDEIVYGKDMKPGEFVTIKVFDDFLTLVRQKGWRYGELYIGEGFDSLRKVDEGEVIDVVDFQQGEVIYQKNNAVYLGNRKIVEVDYPVLGVSHIGDKIAVEVIKEYRTPLFFYDIKGKRIGEEVHDNVMFMDGKGQTLFLVETSFNYKFRVVKKSDGERGEVLMQYGNYDVTVKDLYVKGDVLLHGFLVSKVNNPKGVIVYGYGGFRIPLLPSLTSVMRVLLDEGYSILITNLRGGYENGEEWHKAGMLLNKKNVFKDFAEFLSLVKLMGGKAVAMGGSNGGLLVGATVNEYPGLIDCAVIGHPVLDMLRYDKLYVGKYWVEEYGDPNDPKYREYLLSYSPYHNLKKGLPKTFVYTGINDDRVHPAHALKYVAKSKSLGNDVMLFVNDSGHSIADPESKAREESYVVSFIEECLR
ncbi:prolyl oligopeptidase family serine peptidase [Sulfurisphaera ohwakuensis]|uniref:prolyl oligopeptidase n=1 Tax=Sulfurisphaera ohwakuensis TaxID=69656 RepID=A0A650CK96_SULOH|nr:prolyl oligopeptidase family serine peptidase [Sulfurisphaera ohwakuensis]MBB5254618.1 prolyl oligopeptidase [Sulfurisphaera ohwakuensis]QGR18256.1 prolyl oligopeptidase family serine peptidase [Sulfurisphaera ohwakuensis]